MARTEKFMVKLNDIEKDFVEKVSKERKWNQGIVIRKAIQRYMKTYLENS